MLNKNVKIESDNLILFGDLVKIYFDVDLYDIKSIEAYGNVNLNSDLYKIKASSNELYFFVENEEIHLEGKKSKLITKDSEMYSNGKIIVNNTTGNFYLNGPKSKIIAQNIIIEGEEIDGKFSSNTDPKEVIFLDVYDKNIAYINNNNIEMYANIIKYDQKTSIIELEENVKINRDGEIITGDYGTLNTETSSYKIKSKDSKKVKAILKNDSE